MRPREEAPGALYIPIRLRRFIQRSLRNRLDERAMAATNKRIEPMIGVDFRRLQLDERVREPNEVGD